MYTHIYIHHVHTQLTGLLSMEFQLKVCFIHVEFRKEKHTAMVSSKDGAAEEDIGFRWWGDPKKSSVYKLKWRSSNCFIPTLPLFRQIQTTLQLVILLSHLPKYWDYR